jgi:hypothetical protein
MTNTVAAAILVALWMIPDPQWLHPGTKYQQASPEQSKDFPSEASVIQDREFREAVLESKVRLVMSDVQPAHVKDYLDYRM